MIYRSLRTTRSLQIRNPSDKRRMASLGYASYGFWCNILATNSQTSHEAKQVFYGENYWTLFAGPDFYVSSVMFKLAPLSSALPYMRKVFIRFRLFHWLYNPYQRSHIASPEQYSENFNGICMVLQDAPSLQSVHVIWTETAAFWLYPILGELADTEWASSSGKLVDETSWIIWDIIKPLKTLASAVRITRGEITVLLDRMGRSTAMETAFGNAVDTVIAHRAATSAGRTMAGALSNWRE